VEAQPAAIKTIINRLPAQQQPRVNMWYSNPLPCREGWS